MTPNSYLKFLAQKDKIIKAVMRNLNLEFTDLSNRAFFEIRAQIESGIKFSRQNKISSDRNIVRAVQSYSKARLDQLSDELEHALKSKIKALGVVNYEMEMNAQAIVNNKKKEAPKYEPIKIKRNMFDGAVLVTSHKMEKAIQRIFSSEENHERVDQIFRSALPTTKQFKQRQASVSKVEQTMEAEIVSKGNLDASFYAGMPEVDWRDFGKEWDLVVSDYKKDYLPKWRFGDKISGFAKVADSEIYAWGVEQYATNTILQELKEGTIEAAKQMGVKEMMWVSVLDGRTRCHHYWRDGMTSSEIQKKLDKNKKERELDNGVVAPSGFNCRCRSVPYFENLIDDKESEKLRSANLTSWLNKKVK